MLKQKMRGINEIAAIIALNELCFGEDSRQRHGKRARFAIGTAYRD